MPPRCSKYRRVSAPDFRSNGDGGGDKHEIFTTWAQDRGVQIYGAKAAHLSGRGVGLVATHRIGTGDRILLVPSKAIFKPDTAWQRRRPGAERRASPQAQLTISVMKAIHVDDSPYSCWRDTWPTRDDLVRSMPMCWPEVLRSQLPPAIHQPLERQLADYAKDWAVAQKLCRDRGWGEDDFRYYWMIVNSRSFHWKAARGDAVGTMVLCPFIDYLNHGPTGSGCNVLHTATGYEVTADRDYEPGEELLATYGAHSNDKLLVHYGFICTTTTPDGASGGADDDIRLDHLLLPRLGPDTRDRLRDLGFLGGYALLPDRVGKGGGELCFRTQVAARAAMLTCNEWEHFVANGEDLAADETAAVRDFVLEALAGFREEARERVRGLWADEDVKEEEGGGEWSVARTMLRERWAQIVDAIDAFKRGGGNPVGAKGSI